VAELEVEALATRFGGDEEFKGLLCRISGYTPPRSAGRPAR
jgi:hypothetical protein